MLTLLPSADEVAGGFLLVGVFVLIPCALLFGAYQGLKWIKEEYFYSREKTKRSVTVAGSVTLAVLAGYLVLGNIGHVTGFKINDSKAQASEKK